MGSLSRASRGSQKGERKKRSYISAILAQMESDVSVLWSCDLVFAAFLLFSVWNRHRKVNSWASMQM